MITTFNEFVEANGYEKLKEYEVDKWMGKENVRHINKLLIMSNNLCVLSYDRFIDGHYTEKVWEEKASRVFDYTDIEFVFADTKEEALNDLKFIIKQNKAKAEAHNHNILSILTKFQNEIKGLGCWEQRHLGDIIKKQQDFETLRAFIEVIGYTDNDDIVLNDDMLDELKRVIRGQLIMFSDVDNKGLSTTLNLSQIVSVNPSCRVRTKEAVSIKTSFGQEYNIYKEDDEDLYHILHYLYTY